MQRIRGTNSRAHHFRLRNHGNRESCSLPGLLGSYLRLDHGLGHAGSAISRCAKFGGWKIVSVSVLYSDGGSTMMPTVRALSDVFAVNPLVLGADNAGEHSQFLLPHMGKSGQ